MSDILPKFKMYFFIVFISFLINIAVTLIKGNLDFSAIFSLSVGSFVPFASLVNIVGTSFPAELNIFVLMVLGVISAIETFILAMVVLQLVKNIIWNPDV